MFDEHPLFIYETWLKYILLNILWKFYEMEPISFVIL